MTQKLTKNYLALLAVFFLLLFLSTTLFAEDETTINGKEDEYIKLLEKIEETEGQKSPNLIPVLKDLSKYYETTEDYHWAEETYKSLIMVSYETNDDYTYLDALKKLSTLYREQGKEVKAAFLYKNEIARIEDEYGVNDSFVRWIKAELTRHFNAYSEMRTEKKPTIISWSLIVLFLVLYIFISYATLFSFVKEIKELSTLNFVILQTINLIIVCFSVLYFFGGISIKYLMAENIVLIFTSEFLFVSITLGVSAAIGKSKEDIKYFTRATLIFALVLLAVFYLASKSILVTLILGLHLVFTVNYKGNIIKNLARWGLLLILSYKLSEAIVSAFGVLPEKFYIDSIFDIPTLTLWIALYFLIKMIIYGMEFYFVKTDKEVKNIFSWSSDEPSHDYDPRNIQIHKPAIETLKAKCPCGNKLKIPVGLSITDMACPNCKRVLKLPQQKIEKIKQNLKVERHEEKWVNKFCKHCEFKLQISPAYKDNYIICPNCNHKNLL